MVKKDCRSNSGAIFFVFIFIFQSLNISAQIEIPDSVILERIRLIEKILAKDKPGAGQWWYGWLAGYSAATIGQGAVCFTSNDKGLRQDMSLGAATTLLGVVGQLLTPMMSSYSPDQLTKIPEDTHEARLQKLNVAEELIKASALREKNGRSWQTHAIAEIVNVSSGLITWLGFKRNMRAGIENFALNTVITEAQIWTQPTKTMKDYQNYCKRFESGEKPVTLKSNINWFAGVSPGGFKIKIVF
jgi:hypothetical protein